MEKDVVKVLIVDNASLMCDFVHSAVAQMKGVTLVRANSYRAACDTLASESIDLLLTELNIDAQADLGLILIGRLRTDEFKATSYRIPVIVCTSNANRRLVRDALLYDVADFLIKPISTDIVQAKLMQHLTQSKELKTLVFYNKLYRYRAREVEDKQKVHTESQAWVVLSAQDKAEKSVVEDGGDDSEHLYRMEEFISWPDYASTSNVVLDKHLQRLSFHVNGLNFAYKHHRPLVVLNKERENVCQAMTFFAQVVERNYAEKNNDPLLQHLMYSLDSLEEVKRELQAIDLVHPSKLAQILRRIGQWWTATCSRQFMDKPYH